MASVKLSWSLPTTRASGKPLKASDIAGIIIEQALDGGSFVKLVDSPPTAVERQVDNLEAGDYKFRAACFDTKNRAAAFVEGAITIEDDTPPGLILNLTLSVVGSLATSQG